MLNKISYLNLEHKINEHFVEKKCWLPNYVFRLKYDHYLFLPVLLKNNNVRNYLFQSFKKIIHMTGDNSFYITYNPFGDVDKSYDCLQILPDTTEAEWDNTINYSDKNGFP